MGKKRVIFKAQGTLTLTKMPNDAMRLEFEEMIPFKLKEPKVPKKVKR